jgi:hypothetical protein
MNNNLDVYSNVEDKKDIIIIMNHSIILTVHDVFLRLLNNPSIFSLVGDFFSIIIN